MENTPNFRIVGNISEEKKKEQKNELIGSLFDKHLSYVSENLKKEIETKEHKKTHLEEALIEFANQKSNELMTQSGVASYNVPIQNFHIIPPDLYKRFCGDDSHAQTIYPIQAIFFDEKTYINNPYQFGASAFHEILHLKGHFSAEVNESPDGKLARTPYREGVGIRALQNSTKENGYYEYFRGLHEAIVTSFERDYIRQLIELPELKKEFVDWQQTEKIKKEIAEKEGIDEEDIAWTGKNSKEYIILHYDYFLKVFDYVLGEISKELNNKYPTSESVRFEFLKSHFNGNLISIGRLVEQTFGAGGFRLLGMMDDKKSSIQVLKSLRNLRTLKKT